MPLYAATAGLNPGGPVHTVVPFAIKTHLPPISMYVLSRYVITSVAYPVCVQTVWPVWALSAYTVPNRFCTKTKPPKAPIEEPARGISAFQAMFAVVGPGPVLANVPSGVARTLFQV